MKGAGCFCRDSICISPTMRAGKKTEKTFDMGDILFCQSPNQVERTPQAPANKATVQKKTLRAMTL